MAIYNRWGDKVAIVANLGEQQPKDFAAPTTLVQVQYEDLSKRYQFMMFLKADGGWYEIEQMAKQAPPIELYPKDLRRAIQEAL